MTTVSSETNDALTALERLYAKHVVTLEEAQAAAKLLTGDADAVFPRPKMAAPPPALAPSPSASATPASGPATNDDPSAATAPE